MTREEALETIKAKMDYYESDKQFRAAIETLVPELQENEDERIRKKLIEIVGYFRSRGINQQLCEKFLDYLEKQKEPLGDVSTIHLIKKWIDERKEIWNKSRKEAISLDCSALADDAVVRIEELNSIISFLDTIRCDSTEKQKEQRELPLMNGDADLYFDEWNLQQQNPTKRQCFEEGMRYAQRLQKEQKPAENWKPSEEQMKAFKKYIEEFQARAEAAVGGWNNFDVMIRLYEQLKKL